MLLTSRNNWSAPNKSKPARNARKPFHFREMVVDSEMVQTPVQWTCANEIVALQQ